MKATIREQTLGNETSKRMNIILLDREEIDGNTAMLAGYRADHIVKVLRAKPGDSVKVGIINGKIGYGIIKKLHASKPRTAALELSITGEPPAAPEIDVVLALPRPIMFRRIIGQLATLGCGHIYVINANRVEKSFWDASVVADGLWRSHLVAGLEQAGDTRLPGLSFHKGFKPFIECDVPPVADCYKQMLVADPHAGDHLRQVFRSGRGRLLIAVGPEGGWVDYELQRFAAAGFIGFRIGRRILKVETAVTAIHAMASLLQST